MMNTNQQIAIAAAQDFWGRTWKASLRQAWMTGKYPASLNEHKPVLQQLRNQGYKL